MGFHFYVKTNLVFGAGAAAELPGMIQSYSMKNVMVVYDAGVKAAGISEKVMEQVEKAGVNVTVFDKVIPNPTNEVVEEGASIAKAAEIDGFVAVGGGSSIDLAKAINVLMANPGKGSVSACERPACFDKGAWDQDVVRTGNRKERL